MWSTFFLFFTTIFCEIEERKITIFHTSDIHGYLYGHLHDPLYNAYYGDVRSYIDCRMTFLDQTNETMFVFDSGDIAQGTGLSDATEPPFIKLYPIEDMFGYDAVTLGNHDIGVPESMTWLYSTNFMSNGVTSNIMYTGSTYTTCDYTLPYFRKPYKIIDRDGLKILVLGFQVVSSRYQIPICTAPIADFFRSSVWMEFDLSLHFDFIVALNHIGSNDPKSQKPVYEGIRERYPSTPIIFLNGHNMVIADGRCDAGGYTNGVVDDQCVYVEENKYLEVFGEVVFTLKRDVETRATSIEYNLTTFHKLVITNREQLFSLCPDQTIMPSPLGAAINVSIRDSINELGLFEVLGHSNRQYNYAFETTGADPKIPPGTLFELYLYAIMPSVVLQGRQFVSKDPKVKDFYTFNSGMFRADMFVGEILEDDIYYILPFKNLFVSISPQVSGGDLILALIYLNTRTSKDSLRTMERRREMVRSDIGEKLNSAYHMRLLQDEEHWLKATAPDKYYYAGSLTDISEEDSYTVITSDYDSIDLIDALNKIGTRDITYTTVDYLDDHSINQMSSLELYARRYMLGGVAVDGAAGFDLGGVENYSTWTKYPSEARIHEDIIFVSVESLMVLLGLVCSVIFLLLASARGAKNREGH